MGKKHQRNQERETRSDVIGLILLITAIVTTLSMTSFANTPSGGNWLGLFGHYLGLCLHYLFGFAAFLIPAYLSWVGWRMLKEEPFPNPRRSHLAFLSLVISCSVLITLSVDLFPSLAHLEWKLYHLKPIHLGGTPWHYLYSELPNGNLRILLNIPGTLIIFGGIAAASCLALTDISFSEAVSKMTGKETETPINLQASKQPLISRIRDTLDAAKQRFARPKIMEPIKQEIEAEQLPLPTLEESIPVKEPLQPKYPQPKATPSIPKLQKRELAIDAQRVWNGDFESYKVPKHRLLTDPKKSDQSLLKKDLRTQAERLEETLSSFGIETSVGQINCGPTITSFEVHPSVGVKVQRIKALENDIALNLQAASIRIIAPIPGKAAVGIEIPNPQPQEVGFKELLQSYSKEGGSLNIPLLLGKTVNGDQVTADLAKMPHCIIAGATGSGKSVCINTIVMSIIMTAKPDKIRLLMVDPKKVELSGYSQLPHMLAPVITEPGEASAALNWLVKEMENRYDLLKHLGVRNIEGFNKRSRDLEKELELEKAIGHPVPEELPYIVGIIDELADLMMVSSTDIETPIARIAQMARAVGIHLILATQRPSREVITGIIKANFPTRICFKVASRINSQIVIDDTGGESLLGNGDMLFLPPGSATLIRAQGAFIRDEDIKAAVKHACDQAPPNYVTQSFEEMAIGKGSVDDDIRDLDDLYEKAYEIVISTGNASTTFLQRKLKIGYARAASIMDQLQSQQVIGPSEGSKARKILVKKGGEDDEDFHNGE